MQKASSLILGIGCTVSLASVGLAQRALTTGDRIRIAYAPLNAANESVPPPVVGVFARLHGDSVYAVTPSTTDTVVFAVRNVSHVDISTARYRPVARSTVLGALLGGGAGAIYGYFRAGAPEALCVEFACPTVNRVSRWQNAGRTAMIGGGAGLVLGLIVGRSITIDRWERVNLALQVRSGA